MNKRQKKKRFKKIHGMNPKEFEKMYWTSEMFAKIEAFNKYLQLLSSAYRQRNFAKNLTAMRKAGLRKKGKWTR